jgi:hypothetical protein
LLLKWTNAFRRNPHDFSPRQKILPMLGNVRFKGQNGF